MLLRPISRLGNVDAFGWPCIDALEEIDGFRHDQRHFVRATHGEITMVR